MFLALILLLVRCDSDSADFDNDVLRSGILATFEVEGETFKIWITNAQTIQQILALRDGTSRATIPNGPLASGPGKAAHNAPWNWHMDPAATRMAETTIELCDGLPSFVEADLDQWINVVGRFCPWSAVLVLVEDFR